MHTLSVEISRGNIEDQIAALLYSVGIINHSDTIKSIEFGDMSGKTVPLNITFRKEQEGKLRTYNGGKET